MGTVFSLSKEGTGFLVNYGYAGKSCVGLPNQILRAAVQFRTADSEKIKGAVDFVFQPLAPPTGQPLAYSYRLQEGTENTLILTHTKFVVIENGKMVGQEPIGVQEPQAWYPIPKGLTIKTMIENRLPVFDRTKFDRLIDDVRNRGASLQSYPSFTVPMDEIETVPMMITTAPTAFLKTVNFYLFGSADEFSLIAGKKAGVAQLDPSRKRVSLDPLFSQVWRLEGNDAQAQIELSVAHEIARYLYEFYLLQSSSKNLSLHGKGTSFSGDVWNSLTSAERQNRDQVLAKSFEAAAIHAEIDALSVAILIRMGADVPQLRERFTKRRELLEARLFGVNLGSETEVSFIATEEYPALIELYVREFAILKYLRQY